MRVFSGALSGVLRVYRGCCKGLGVLSCKGQGFMVVVGFPADAVRISCALIGFRVKSAMRVVLQKP